MVRREYVEDISRSQHQQHLDSILRVNRENSEEKLLKKNNGLSKLFNHIRLVYNTAKTIGSIGET